jgi:hypothetical protein
MPPLPLGVKDRVCCNTQFPSADIQDEIAVMDAERGRYYGLDDISSAIYKKLSKPMLVATLCEELTREYNADAAVVEHDVLVLLRQMLESKLIVLLPEDGL